MIFQKLFCLSFLASAMAATFDIKPRVRREWRTLTPEMRQKVANAFWTVKTTLTEDGKALYGDKFINYDDILLLHACAVLDPRCDQGHYGPQFITFHRAVVLQMENALLAVDPSIGAIPYWDYSKDTIDGEYYQDGENYIFSDTFFGDYIGNPDANYAVTNGLFANWPIAEYTSERFGAASPLDVKCTREEYFAGYVATTCERCCGIENCECDQENDVFKWFHRFHDDCTPYVARNANEGLYIDNTLELRGTDAEFKACNDPANIQSWMDWQNCIEFEQVACLLYLNTGAACDEILAENVKGFPTSDPALASLRDKTAHLAGVCAECGMDGFYYDSSNKKQHPEALHSQAHIRVGRDLLDVTTSPNDAGLFMGYHANVDRNNFIWMMNTRQTLERHLWLYPQSQTDYTIDNEDRLSGPFSSYDLLICGADLDHFNQYKPLSTPWLPGTLLNDVANSGFPFTNIFDEPPANEEGYTHEEIIYYTSPQRTPYTYDTLESYYYDGVAE